MSKFTESVKETTPRFVVQFRLNDKSEEEFTWGICGSVPIAQLIGGLVIVQSQLANQASYLDECDQLALVLAWCPEKRAFDSYVHHDIPIGPLCGMLEIIKHTLTGTHIARQMAAQQVQPRILGIDGRPIQSIRH